MKTSEKKTDLTVGCLDVENRSGAKAVEVVIEWKAWGWGCGSDIQ